METFAKLFERFLVFVYHCFDRIVIQGYLPLLTRPEHIVYWRIWSAYARGSSPLRIASPVSRPSP